MLRAARRYSFNAETTMNLAMNLARLTALTFSICLAGVSAVSAASVNGSAALALAGVVAPYSPSLSASEKKAVAAFFA